MITRSNQMSRYILLSIVTVISAVKTGYVFMAFNHTHYFLKPFSLLNPNFAPNDWFVRQTESYHHAFTYMIVLIHKYLPFKEGVFGAWLLYIFLFVLGVYKLTTHLTDDRRVFVLTMVFTLFSIQKGWGYSLVLGNLLDAGLLGIPFFILSIAYLMSKDYLLSGLLLGLSGTMHIQFGAIGVCVFGIYFIINYKSLSPRKILTLTAGFLAVFSFNYISNLNYIRNSDWADFKIFAFERAPQHYLPSTWRTGEFVKMSALIFLGGYCAIKNKLKDNTLVLLSGIILFLCGLAAVFTEVYFVPSIAIIMFWRITPIIIISSFIYGAALVFKLLDQHGWEGKFRGWHIILAYLSLSFYFHYLVPLILLALLVIGQYLKRYTSHSEKLEWSIYALYSGLILLCFFLFKSYHPYIYAALGIVVIHEVLRKKSKHTTNLAAAIIFVPFLVGQFIGYDHINFNIKQIEPYWYGGYYEEVFAWVKDNTDPHDNFIIPPKLQGFRLKTGRGIMVNWKCTPSGSGGGMKEWKKRMEALKNYHTLTPKKVRELAQKYNMTYFMAPSYQMHKTAFLAQGFEKVFQSRLFSIYKINI